MNVLKFTDKKIRILQGLFLGLILVSTIGSLISGNSLLTAVGQGIIIGGLNFISIAVLLAMLLLIYVVYKKIQTQPSG